MMTFIVTLITKFRLLYPNQVTKNFDYDRIERAQVDAAHSIEYRRKIQLPFPSPTEDRISELSDDILSYILSHLTLRDAVRTRTLSRRWTNLRLPNLDLDWHTMSGIKFPCHVIEGEQYTQKYINCVDQVLQLYNDVNITSFHLSFCFKKNISANVDRWINFAADKGLQSLKLQFICVDDTRVPRSLDFHEFYVIYSSFLSRFHDLKNLCLNSCILMINDDFMLNRLVKLDLNYVVLDAAKWQCLLSKASSIEWLRLRGCNLPEKLTIGDNLCSLNFLMIHNCPDLRDIEINSSHLKTLEFVGEGAVDFSYLNAPRLENVYAFPSRFERNSSEYFIKNLAHRFSGIVTLFLEATYSVIHYLPTRSGTQFNSVLRLYLYIHDENFSYDLRKVMPRVLKSFPNLQKLSVQLPPMVSYMITSGIPEDIPVDNLHDNLKEVELGDFELPWLFFASYLWRSCSVLEQLIIRSISRYYYGCGLWTVLNGSGPMFGPNQFEKISAALQGKAVSPTAQLIVRDDGNCDHLQDEFNQKTNGSNLCEEPFFNFHFV